jgi:glycosyltransferase involved in cell wall biosynthesis
VRLSIVIPCYNAADTIGAQLDALAKQHWQEPWEVLVSDNGSSDNSREVVQSYRERLPNLQLVDSADRPGSAHARNVGAHAATGDAILFCDADDEVGVGWLAAMGEALLVHSFVASRMEFQKLNNPGIASHFRSHPQTKDLQKLWYPPYLSHAGGSGLGVKRLLHEAVSGFDESLMRLMDTDYCLRIQLRGIPFHFVPNAVIHVRCKNNSSDSFRQARLWGEYNVLMYKRYRPPGRGEQWRGWKNHAIGWRNLFQSTAHLWTTEERMWWMWRLGWQVGILNGSVKHRVSPIG